MATERNQNNLFYSIVIMFLLNSIVAFTKAQDIRSFPSPNVPSTFPLTTNILNEQVYDLTMTGATTTRVSKVHRIYIGFHYRRSICFMTITMGNIWQHFLIEKKPDMVHDITGTKNWLFCLDVRILCNIFYLF